MLTHLPILREMFNNNNNDNDNNNNNNNNIYSLNKSGPNMKI